ncbi:hypothetical protein BBD41_11410 [Paenibacillus ihbetae]|uniref:Uncharacterized protein n=1 Tax=Paenibacillus ihbetae TaxID=1870820 RepID=A0A1B2DZN5_9BACL|nr:hypothetical protein [Paenibacillus ihbetae]ANY73149.1 hypothetical protein BBD41_11410 [Paenibacillus ihbetae]
MRKLKKLIAAVVSMSLLLSVPISVSANSTESVESQLTYDVKTPEDYITFLKQTQVKYSFSNSVDSTDINEYIDKFLSLPEDKQQKFVDYLNDPEFLKTTFSAINEQTEGSQSFYNGDLVVRSSMVEVSPASSNISPMAIGDTKDYSYYHESITQLMGLDFVKTRVELKVRTTEVKTNASQITEIVHARGVLVQNYVPLAHIAKKEYPVDIASDKSSAKFTTDWSWNFIWDKLGLQVGTKRQWVQITKAGTATGGISNL